VLLAGASTCSYAAGTCVTFGYDGDGNLTSMHDVTGLTTYGYDQLNRLAAKTLPSSASFGQVFDGAGNLTSYTDAGGTVAYGYNDANQLTSLAEPGGTCSGTPSLCTAFGVNANGQRTSTAYPDGAGMAVTLDDAGRPTEVKTSHGPTVIADFSYSYTSAGADTELVQSRTDGVTGRVTTYGYDARDELTRATERSGTTVTAQWVYCYDDAGNRTHTSTSTSAGAGCATSPTTSYGYNTANELTTLNGSGGGWTYDGNGNETAANSPLGARTSESWTPANQLASVTAAGVTTAKSYANTTHDERVAAGATGYQTGPLGLASQTSGGATTYSTRDPTGALVSERAGSNHYYYAFDGLGSVVALLDSSGNAADTYSYDPYGVARASTGSVANPFQYTAGYHDPDGLYHYGARYYDTTLGRFTQQDPAAQGPNLYTYAAGNPVNLIDPHGRSLLGDLIGLGTAVAGLGLAIAGAVVSTPLIIGIGIGVAAAGVLIGGDIVGCDLGTGLACGVF
jgi:RHS repeat-associated protein